MVVVLKIKDKERKKEIEFVVTKVKDKEGKKVIFG
jgi:hypothetical protein